MGRLQAIVQRCAIQGGDCPCGLHECKARVAILDERIAIKNFRTELDRQESECDRLQELLDRKPATVRPDWSMPEKPSEGYRPAAVNEGEWEVGWVNDDDDWVPIIGDDSWPFVEEEASDKDWERLGFEVH